MKPMRTAKASTTSHNAGERSQARPGGTRKPAWDGADSNDSLWVVIPGSWLQPTTERKRVRREPDHHGGTGFLVIG